MTPDECRRARLAMGWSEAELAQRAGITALTVIRFESGRKWSNRKVAQAIAAALAEEGAQAAARPSRRPPGGPGRAT
ncbi:MAG: helix-turn-helix transcriptional regulator [Alsobacter sp.]